jgi:hypothetical protein
LVLVSDPRDITHGAECARELASGSRSRLAAIRALQKCLKHQRELLELKRVQKKRHIHGTTMYKSFYIK